MIVMDAQTQLKVDIISKVSEGKISIRNASKLLKKSRRTVERYLEQYRKVGILFAVHKNSKRSPVNKGSDKVKRKVQRLIKNKYYDFNLTHLNEKLEKDEKILLKRETLRNWAHEIHQLDIAQALESRNKPTKIFHYDGKATEGGRRGAQLDLVLVRESKDYFLIEIKFYSRYLLCRQIIKQN